MVIQNYKTSDIEKNKKLSSNFFTVYANNLKSRCRIYKGNFYLDSYNYFPITKENFSFLELFSWNRKSKYNHFYSKDFALSFEKRKNSFKTINDVVVLGSNIANNYYRNLISFFPRILFLNDKNISIAIHRNSSNKFRVFIENILLIKGIKLKKIIYLDNDFYYFKNSQIPQFFSMRKNIIILNKLSRKNIIKNKLKIYLTRKNAFFRKLINEADLIEELKLKNFTIIDTDTLSIDEQINIFSSAEIVIGPTGSALANIVFCKKGTKIVEIIPEYKYAYENVLKLRYSNICTLLDFEYHSIQADSVDIKNTEKFEKYYIDASVIKNSNYYKNLIIKENIFKELINKF